MQILLTYGSDLMLMAASLGAAAYCMVLSRRLTRLGSFDKGIGGAIAVLSAQVEEMKSALGEAKAGTDGAGRHLDDLVNQAREISSELEMMIAACHDFAEQAIDVQDRRPDEGTEHRAPGDQREAAATATMPGDEASVPLFGSRRSADTDSETASDAPIAMFRHRANDRS